MGGGAGGGAVERAMMVGKRRKRERGEARGTMGREEGIVEGKREGMQRWGYVVSYFYDLLCSHFHLFLLTSSKPTTPAKLFQF